MWKAGTICVYLITRSQSVYGERPALIVLCRRGGGARGLTMAALPKHMQNPRVSILF